MLKLVSILLHISVVLSAQSNVLQFENLGFDGTYWSVASMKDLYSDKCTCELDDDKTSFSGTNAPLNEEVSVHFRGPLVLNKFAYYVSSSFAIDGDDNQDWERLSYYDSSSQTSENVTFLTKAGKNSTCLGVGLTYADTDGISKSDSSQILAEDTLIKSEEEFVIFSNISCGSSKVGGDCQVYRDDIPAYHGFYGTTKMFLFEFKMPEEDSVEKGSVYNWNMPAIWLLNAQIPRTSQYSLNSNCSCWASGCGEFDIFEVKNYTDSDVDKLFATIHDYQGTGYINEGIQIDSYIERNYDETMKGGVVFDNDGNAIVFVSNSTTFDQSIGADDINSVIKALGSASTLELSSVEPVSTSTAGGSSASSSKDSSGSIANVSTWMITLFTFLLF
ncbi:GPI-anchored protein 52 [[Candida] jaroonii]|uniref:GPI-anchored protein 52 n=1 Tax=[Candida] jaroonii TaxID=467808 RepID=A0ACA9YBZ7_9ASCO|nr:GPI-anchored protein 52 [[Candida] jaroonii]